MLQIAKDNPKFKAIDRAIGKESFKVVTLLRLSPLLPLALSNYFYGITRCVMVRMCHALSRFTLSVLSAMLDCDGSHSCHS